MARLSTWIMKIFMFAYAAAIGVLLAWGLIEGYVFLS